MVESVAGLPAGMAPSTQFSKIDPANRSSTGGTVSRGFVDSVLSLYTSIKGFCSIGIIWTASALVASR
jgi:hypothetical protein